MAGVSLAAAILSAAPVHALPNDRDWPSVVVSPAINVPMQDTAITRAPDLSAVPAQAGGTYYLTGTVGKEVSGFSVQVSGKGVTETSGLKPETRNLTPSHDFDNGRQVKLWKSRDLKKWDEVGVVFDLENPAGDYAKHRWMTRQSHKDPSRADSPICWGIKAPELHRVGKDWYICFSMNNQGTGLIKSTTGKIEGPYVSLGKVGGQLGKDPGPVFDDTMFYHDGTLYASDWQNWRDYVAVADLNKPGWKWDWKKVDHGIYDIMQRGDVCSVDSVEGVPIYCFRSAGRQDHGEIGIHTYDVNYVPMETVWGPVVKGAKPRNIPHVAMSNLFKDHKGRWWSSLFGSSEPAVPWSEKFGLVPLRVEKRGDHDVSIDVEDDPSDELKRIIGGGQIAEVKTVAETLE
jgi:hypothetical protein